MSIWGKKSESSTGNGGNGDVVPHISAAESSPRSAESSSGGERKPEPSAQASLDRYGKIRSALDSGTVIQGKLTFDTPVRIDGKLSGEIFSSSALVIGATGVIDATVEVASLIVLGSLKGNVKVSERIEVFSGGKVEGSLTTPVLVLENGCSLNGECRMPQPETRQEKPKDMGIKGKPEAAPFIKPGEKPATPGAPKM